MIHPNVQSALSSGNIAHKCVEHSSFAVPIANPADFAAVLGYLPCRIAKTLLVKGKTERRFALIVAPAPSRIQLDVVARLLQVSKITFASREDLDLMLGYPPTGVSPLGAGSTPVFMEESLLAYPTILIGSGSVGVEIECSPIDLARITLAKPVSLVVPSSPCNP